MMRRIGVPFLPNGTGITPDAWLRRHRWIVATLWIAIPVLVLLGHQHGWVVGSPPEGMGRWIFGALLGVLAVLVLWASLPGAGRRARAVAASLAAVSAAAGGVVSMGGPVEAHVLFLLALAVITIYQDWLPLVSGAAATVAFALARGAFFPAMGVDRPMFTDDPWIWVFLQSGFVVAVTGIGLLHWWTARKVSAFTDRLVSTSNQAIVSFDRWGELVFMNPAAERLLGRKERLATMGPARVMARQLGVPTVPPLEHAVRFEGHGRRLVTPEGETRYVDWVWSGPEDPAPDHGTIVTLMDVTGRHLAESRLRAQGLQLAAAQGLARVGSFEWAPVADVLRVSDELRRILERGHGGPVPAIDRLDDLLMCIHPEDRPSVRETFHQVHRCDVSGEVACRVGYDAKMRHCEVRLRLHEDASGSDPVRVVQGAWHDVTERLETERTRIRAEAQMHEILLLREQDRFKTRFINAIAHELNTPLTPLRLQLHLLGRDPDDRLSDAQRRAIQMLERNADRFGRLVENLLDAARLQAGRLRLASTRFDMGPLLEDTVAQIRPQMASRDLRFVMVCDASGDTEIEGDPGRIGQVLSHLVANACKFTQDGGTVECGARQAGNEVIAWVRDDGPGIGKEAKTRLFQPFAQVHDTMESTEPGTGLGLYLCRGIIALHGGRIWCESEGEGEGAAFCVALPRVMDRSLAPVSGVVAKAWEEPDADRVEVVIGTR